MIIKIADDKQPQLDVLQNLLTHPDADLSTRKRIEQEIRNIKAGLRGEAEAAYEMKVYFGDTPNWMVLHDLRIEVDGLVAQIDHLLINRTLEAWVCESKHFSEGISINEHGEFTAFFGSKPYGVPSPIEQNRRHILVLKRLFDSGAVNLPTRLGFTLKPELRSLVLVSKGARISRPKKALDGLDVVIKNDQLVRFIDKSMESASSLSLARVVSTETLEGLARSIAAQHRPIDFNWSAKFGLASANPSVVPPPADPRPSDPAVQHSSQAESQADKPKKKLECHECSVPVPYNVAKFCWFNKPKFGGNIYCIECQKKVGA